MELLEDRSCPSTIPFPVGGEFQVNSLTTGSQTAPSVATDSNGNFVVAWTSAAIDGNGLGISAQRYNASGVAQGSEFRVNTTTAGDQRAAAVAMDSDGDFVVVWVSSDGNGDGIYAQRFNAAGVAQGGEFLVNTYTTGAQIEAAAAMDASGNFVIAWASNLQDASSYGVYAQRYNAAGVAQGSEFRVNTYTTNSQRDAAASMDSSGKFVVSWTSALQDGSSYGVYAKRFNASGVVQGSEFRVNSNTSGSQSDSRVGHDSSGNFVVSWTSANATQDGNGDSVYFRRYNAAGTAQGSDTRANVYTLGNQRASALAVDADGEIAIAWTSANQESAVDQGGVYVRRFSAAGVALGGEVPVNTFTTGGQTSPAIAGTANGNFVVAWQSVGQDGFDESIHARRFLPITDVVDVLNVRTPFTSSIATGQTLASTFKSITVEFAADMATSGVGSATDPANWALTKNGQSVMNQVSSITSSYNATTQRGEVTLQLLNPLPAGEYVLTAKASLRDAVGRALDGNSDGVAGDDFSRSFTLTPPYPTSAETRVNMLTSGNQQLPAIAGNADGNSVVVWSAGSSLYFQRYDASGAAVGGETLVDTSDTTISRARVAMDANGDFVVVATDGVYSPYNPPEVSVKAYRYSAGGVFLGSSVAAGDIGFPFDEPAIAMDGNGSFVVTWTYAGYEVMGRRFDSSGAAQGAAFLVSSATGGIASNSTIAVDADGDFVVAWASDQQDGSSTGVYARRYNAAGVAQGAEFLVNVVTTGAQASPAIAMNAQGDFLIVWTSAASGSAIMGRHYSAAGAALTSEFVLASGVTNELGAPALAMQSDGSYYLTYARTGAYDTATSSDTVFARYFPAGSAAGPEFRVNTYATGNQNRPQAIVSPTGGELAIVWESAGQDGNGAGVYLQRYTTSSVLAGGQYYVNEGQGVTLAAVGPDSPSAVYEWDLDGDDAFDDATGMTVALTWSQLQGLGLTDGPASRAIRVRVTEGVIVSISSPTAINIVNVAPTIALSGAGTGTEGVSYTLTLGAVTDPGPDTVTQYIVNWGDGSSNTYTSAGLKTHSFLDSGNRTISVSLVDEDGTHAAAGTLTVAVANQAPTGSITGPTTVSQNASVAFSFSMTDPSSADQSSSSTTWKIDWNGDGVNDQTITGARPQSVNRVFASQGAFNVRLIVQDKDGAESAPVFKLVTVGAPDSAGGPYVINEGDALTLTAATAAFDSGNGQTVYTWDVDGDGQYDDATGRIITIPWSSLKTLTGFTDGPSSGAIAVRIVNSALSAAGGATTTFTLNNSPPTVSTIGSPATVYRNQNLNYTFQASDPSTPDQNGLKTWSIDWDGDGVVDQTTSTTATTLNAAHLYAAPGEYTIRARVTDKDGGVSAEKTKTITVLVPPDSAGSYTLNEGGSISLTGWSSIDFFDGATTYAWDLDNDGQYDDATGKTAAINWTTWQSLGFTDGPAAARTIGLYIFNSNTSESRTATGSVTLVNVRPTLSVSGPSSGAAGTLYSFTLNATDPSAVDQAAGFTFQIDWDDDGTVDQTVVGPSGTVVTGSFAETTGLNFFEVRAIDKDGGVSLASRKSFNANPSGLFLATEGQSLYLDFSNFLETSHGSGTLSNFTWDVNGDGIYGDFALHHGTMTWAQFEALGVNDGPRSNTISARWDFAPLGGGPVVTYEVSGALNVVNVVPTASIVGPDVSYVGQDRAFVLNATDPSAADQASDFSFAIDWNGDGSTDQTVVGPSGTSLLHSFASAGNYTIRVVATDKDGGVSAVATQAVEVMSGGASIGGPYAINEGDSLQLAAGDASDPGDGSYLYSWDVNGDGVFGDATGPAPLLTWNQLVGLGLDDGPDSVSIALRITDTLASVTTTLTGSLSIANVAPTLFVSGPSSATYDDTLQLTLTVSDLSPADQAANFTFRIDWDGNGIYEQTVVGPSGTVVSKPLFNFLHGSANVKVTATDKNGGVSQVVDQYVSLTPAYDFTITEGDSIYLNPFNIGVGFLGDIGYGWDFDGDTSIDFYGDILSLSWSSLVAFTDVEDGPGVYQLGFVNYYYLGLGHVGEDYNVTSITVINKPPSLLVSGPGTALRGEATSYTFTATDASLADHFADFTYAIDWNGDDIVDQTVVGDNQITVDHVFETSGPVTIKATATDKDGGVSNVASRAVDVARYKLVANTENPGLIDLYWNGTAAGESIYVLSTEGQITIYEATADTADTIGGVTGTVHVDGRGGDDTISALSPNTVAVLSGGEGNDSLFWMSGDGQTATLLGGDGDDVLAMLGGSGNTLVFDGGDDNDQLYFVNGAGNSLLFSGAGGDDFFLHVSPSPEAVHVKGGLGNDSLAGGPGADLLEGEEGNDLLIGAFDQSGPDGGDTLRGGDGADLLVGGLGANTLEGGEGSDLLIAGSLAFLAPDVGIVYVSLAAEWTSGRPYATQVANLSGVGAGPRENGDNFLLPASTVLDNGVVDEILGGDDEDWILMAVGQDLAPDLAIDETVTDLA